MTAVQETPAASRLWRDASLLLHLRLKGRSQERPCLHCMMVELIDDFLAEYTAAPGGSDKVDTDEADEVIDAIAKTVAELN